MKRYRESPDKNRTHNFSIIKSRMILLHQIIFLHRIALIKLVVPFTGIDIKTSIAGDMKHFAARSVVAYTWRMRKARTRVDMDTSRPSTQNLWPLHSWQGLLLLLEALLSDQWFMFIGPLKKKKLPTELFMQRHEEKRATG